MVAWEELPLELCGEIAKRLSCRLDFIRFWSVCNRWRKSLPAPTRFPLLVPRPPNSNLDYKVLDNFPYFITEANIYSVDIGLDTNEERLLVGSEELDQGGKFCTFAFTKEKRLLVEFEELDQGGKFCTLAFLPGVPGEVEFDFPTVTTDPENELYRLSFVAKSYNIRSAFPRFDSLQRRVEGEWCFESPLLDILKIVLISSDNADVIDASYVPASDLSVVALLHEHSLALLRLGGSQDPNWNWDTGFYSGYVQDIATYKGQLYAIDFHGTVSLMDYNSSKMTEIGGPLCTEPYYKGWMRLVESCGDMYVFTGTLEYKDVKVFKLSFRLCKWVEIDDIGDQAFLWFKLDCCNISLPRDVFTSIYGRWMTRCSGGHTPFQPFSLISSHYHLDDEEVECGHGNAGYGFLHFTTQHCIPWRPRPETSTASTMRTTTSSILSQQYNSVDVPVRTTYFDMLMHLMSSGSASEEEE